MTSLHSKRRRAALICANHRRAWDIYGTCRSESRAESSPPIARRRTGQTRVDEGRVLFDGRDLTNRPPEEIARAGIARTFQLVKVFREMTVLDNVIVGAFLREVTRRAARERAIEALRIAGLASVAASLAGELPVALQKRIELARALATGPSLIVLDEALSGLTPAETRDALEVLRALRQRAIALLVVEHVMEVIMTLSDRVVVLDAGRRIASGSP